MSTGWPMAGLDLAALLSQRGYWIAESGAKVPVKEIDRRYARNILHFMLRVAPDWKEAVEMIYVAGPEPSGDMAQDAFDREFTSLLEMDTAVWIQQQPLYRAILRRTR